MINVILCGGSGTRLWPISRDSLPKQFHAVYGKHTLFQQTVLRNIKHSSKVIIILNQDLYFVAIDQLEEINVSDYVIMIEEEGRDTAAAIALAALYVKENYPEEVMLITPSDHIIKNETNYFQAISNAKHFAEQDNIVVFGITPTSPEIGYGYIEKEEDNGVKRFVEKPNLEKAKQYLQNGSFFWNSGMFIFKSDIYLNELNLNAQDIYINSADVYEKSKKNLRFKQADLKLIPKLSIDYAVIEKCTRLKMVYGDFDWSDLGSFDSLYTINDKDENGNIINTEGVILDSKNNYFQSNGRTLCAIGVEDLIVIDSDDALLITKIGSSQRVKEVVSELKLQKSELVKFHTEVYRPWGHYKVLEEENNDYKIKKILVKPRAKISLQKHLYRSEHWIVVSGVALLTKEDKKYTVEKNQSIYISPEEIHRIENDTDDDLVLIEVQVGDYLGEDDIIRFDDIYDRK